jgi:transcriptional regulator with GAF, ATPase, and Fis domain
MREPPFQIAFKMAQHILGELDTRRALASALDAVIDLCQAERGMILLFKPDGSLHCDTARNLERRDVENPEFKISRTIIRDVRRSGAAAFHPDLPAHPGGELSESVQRLGLLAVICLPLIRGEEVFGVVYLDNRSRREAFTEETLALAESFAEFISLAAYNALERDVLRSRVSSLEERLREENRFEGIIGASSAMVEMLRLVSQVARAEATVLIEGESGTGKELVARAIHATSERRDGPFVPLNCGALPETLQESELFGHLAGAFTGASKARKGWVEHAARGTLFLDEVGEMSPQLQVKFLRVLENGEYSPVGSTEIRGSDVRVVAATNRSLASLVEQGGFRQDLHYRLDVFKLTVPPLRERREDLPLLVRHFLEKLAKDGRTESWRLSPEAVAALEEYRFPGNVRELRNILERATLVADGAVIETSDLPRSVLDAAPDTSTSTGEPSAPAPALLDEDGELRSFKDSKQELIERFEREYIERALTETGGNITQAARLAEIDVKNFHTKLTRYGIDANRYRS